MQNDNVKPPAPRSDDDGLLSPLMSENAFAAWGAEDIAYISKISLDGATAWAIVAADGTTLGTVPDRNLAFAAASQNDRVPVSVH
jgi:hypothetical protein